MRVELHVGRAVLGQVAEEAPQARDRPRGSGCRRRSARRRRSPGAGGGTARRGTSARSRRCPRAAEEAVLGSAELGRPSSRSRTRHVAGERRRGERRRRPRRRARSGTSPLRMPCHLTSRSSGQPCSWRTPCQSAASAGQSVSRTTTPPSANSPLSLSSCRSRRGRAGAQALSPRNDGIRVALVRYKQRRDSDTRLAGSPSPERERSAQAPVFDNLSRNWRLDYGVCSASALARPTAHTRASLSRTRSRGHQHPRPRHPARPRPPGLHGLREEDRHPRDRPRRHSPRDRAQEGQDAA